MNPYETLGVRRDATASDIKKAFRKKASEAHPDHGGSQDDFVALKRAHAVLSSPEARRKYDTHGELPPEGAAIDPDHVARAFIANMISGLIETAPENFATQDLVHVGGKITEYRRSIAANEDGVKLPQRALEILEDYQFKPEAPSPSQNDLAAHAFFGFRNSSAT